MDYDNNALNVVNELRDSLPDIEFVTIKPNEDLPFAGEETVVIMDVVEGIEDIKVFDNKDLDKLVLPSRTSVHDFDLGFQLKYLRKLGKLGKVIIIGIPMRKEVDYSSIQLILRKLVAHDMQGS